MLPTLNNPPLPATPRPALSRSLSAAIAVSMMTIAAISHADEASLLAIGVAPSAQRIGEDIATLAGFGTRHTLSETESDTRGIGAARRWIKSEFDQISAACGGCLEVIYVSGVVSGTARIPDATEVVNVVAIQRGTRDSNRFVVMSGDIDSRVSDIMNSTDDAPGANDNASGMAGVTHWTLQT
jgi:Zn-dependent M28 family amino/carboxypeptidase